MLFSYSILSSCLCLYLKKPEETNTSLVTKMTDLFEERLYRISSSQSLYSDQSTLESRVKLLAMQIGKKIEAKRHHLAISKKENNVSRISRLDALKAKVGQEMFSEIVELVNKIEEIKLCEYMVILRSCKNSNAQSHDHKRIPNRISVSTPHQTVPKQVHDIYFRTHLANAFHKVTSTTLAATDMAPVENADWESLIQIAKVNIEAFHQYAHNHPSSVTDTCERTEEV